MGAPQMPEGFMQSGPPLGQEEPKGLAVVPAVAGIMAGPGETASTAVAAMAKAQIEARYLMALQRPRSMANVRIKLLDACRRPRFAATSRYAKPMGGNKKVLGWSIRFAEEVARCLGNVLVEAAVTYDDATVRVLRVMVTDLEANVSYPFDVSVTKTVERSNPDGKQVLGQRRNSRGETTYIVAATDDDVLNKQNALVSKAMRTGILRVLPGDLLEEAEEVVLATMKDADAADPAGKAKEVADAFHSLGVMPAQIEGVLGHPMTQCTPAEVTMMRSWYTALREGEASWKEIVASFGDAPAPAQPAPSKGVEGMKNRLAKDAPRERQPGED